jgi:translocation and assembly module TamA
VGHHGLVAGHGQREAVACEAAALGFGAQAGHELVAAEGYFSPQVRVTAIEGGARVQVEPGPRTRVGPITLRFEGDIASEQRQALRESIERNWRMTEGEPFRSESWEQAKRGLLDDLRDRGFLRARLVDSEALVDQEQAMASLDLTIDSGSPVRFGPLSIEGLQRYPPDLIEGIKSFREGDPYDMRQIADLQTRLNGAGWFTTVNVRPDVRALTESPELEAVPVRVEVIERPAKRWTLGAGYDADRGPSVLAGWENRNVGGLGIQTFNGIEIDPQRGMRYGRSDPRSDGAAAGN